MNDKIKAELIGGPDDGLILSIVYHRYEWLMPYGYTNPVPFALPSGSSPLRPEMRVSVYRRIDGTDNYKFFGYRGV